MAPIRPFHHTPLLPGTLRNLFYPPEEDQYQYFARAAEHPFAGSDFVAKAAWAADAAMLCYDRYGPDRMSDGEFEANLARGGLTLSARIGQDPNDWNAPGTQAFFAEGEDFAMLAFRGTEVDDPADQRTDLDLLLAPEPPHGLVHRGFQKALKAVWAEVQGVVAGYRAAHAGNEICIAGHSLGGALALLSYSRLAEANVSAYTIGCPRVGDRGFRDHVAACSGLGHHRFVNGGDLVTHIPLESALYVHAPEQCFRFDEDGNLTQNDQDGLLGDLRDVADALFGLPVHAGANRQLLDRPAPPRLVDHSPARYCMRLWDCVA